ncbi:hypothetical protein MMC08_008681 [Hypocenomyce scalaris]|nr:hypothetical protein [Hypocenomyce scalaris]
MLAELKNSTEPRELVKRAQEYLRGIIGGIVRKKKEIESKKNASSGATPLNEPQTGNGYASVGPKVDIVRDHGLNGHPSIAATTNSGHRPGKENKQSMPTSHSQAPGEVWEV